MIRDDDLLAALDAGTVAAVGLDVFEHEPAIDPRYLTLKNAFLMPHLAAETIETQTAVGMLALDNIDAVLAGRGAESRERLILRICARKARAGSRARTWEASSDDVP